MRRRRLLADLFAGGGGFTRGFHEVGFESVLAVEVDDAAARTYVANFPKALTVVEDIRSLECGSIRALIGRRRVEVVIGSPPCEPFTGSNPERMEDPLDRLYRDEEGRLVLEFIRVLECLDPDYFVMENVPAILEGDLRGALRDEFGRAGYSVHFNLLRAEDYETPSRRLRVFISNLRLEPPRAGRTRTVWETLSDLPEPSHDPVIPNHEPPPNLSKSKLKRSSRLKWGGSMVMYEGAGGRALPNLIRLHPHRVAPTVLGASRFIHPYENRLLTVREQARLMGFADDHVFMGGREQQYNQVGEAVPPPLARVIALEILKHIGEL
ncbi:MAG: DNA cytosine methyltransferase [Zestosphaera sp.]